MVQGNEKKERTYPFAGDTDNDATYHDDYVAEAARRRGRGFAND
jgi:hypothetical protein